MEADSNGGGGQRKTTGTVNTGAQRPAGATLATPPMRLSTRQGLEASMGIELRLGRG